VLRCGRCGTARHAECAGEDPRCTVYGCRGVAGPRSTELATFFWHVPRWREALRWGHDRARLVPRAVRGVRAALRRALARMGDALTAPSRAASARVRARLATAHARRALVEAIDAEWTARLHALAAEAAQARERAPAEPVASVSLLWVGGGRGGRPAAVVDAILAHARAERRLGAAEAERDEERRRALVAPLDEVERARATRLARWAREG
jgi:hypothetical protein